MLWQTRFKDQRAGLAHRRISLGDGVERAAADRPAVLGRDARTASASPPQVFDAVVGLVNVDVSPVCA
jgi:hypothetical protein